MLHRTHLNQKETVEMNRVPIIENPLPVEQTQPPKPTPRQRSLIKNRMRSVRRMSNNKEQANRILLPNYQQSQEKMMALGYVQVGLQLLLQQQVIEVLSLLKQKLLLHQKKRMQLFLQQLQEKELKLNMEQTPVEQMNTQRQQSLLQQQQDNYQLAEQELICMDQQQKFAYEMLTTIQFTFPEEELSWMKTTAIALQRPSNPSSE